MPGRPEDAVLVTPGEAGGDRPANELLVDQVVVLRTRLAALVLAVAGAAALSWVPVGVQHPHDVLAGAALAATA